MSSSNDEAVRGTNTSATECKACAVKLGYYEDAYIHHFVNAKSERRQPEINRGNFIRVRLVRELIEQFIARCKAKQRQYQIVSLGCGFDTLYWRLADAGHSVSSFVETDFAEITAKKAFIVNKVAALKRRVVDGGGGGGGASGGGGSSSLVVANKGTDIHGANYHLVAGDLKKFSEEGQLEGKLRDECNLDFASPTLVLSECVLVYLPPEKTAHILRWFTSKFKTCFFVNYEQVNLDTRFAQVMIENLRRHQCDLLGKDACLSLETQRRRFVDCGCAGAGAINVWRAYEDLPHQVKSRIERIEFLDEFEIMKQLLEHYCVSWAWKNDAKDGLDLDHVTVE